MSVRGLRDVLNYILTKLALRLTISDTRLRSV